MKQLALLPLLIVACSHSAEAPLAQVDSGAGGSSGSAGSGGMTAGTGSSGGSAGAGASEGGSAAAGSESPEGGSTGNEQGGSGDTPCEPPPSFQPAVGEGVTDPGFPLPRYLQMFRTMNIGNPSSPDGWKEASVFFRQIYMPNDGSPVQPGSVCKLHPQVDPNAVYPHDYGGINAFSRTLLPLLKERFGLSTEALNQAIDAGSFTWGMKIPEPDPIGQFPGPDWIVSGAAQGDVSWTKDTLKVSAFDLSLNPSPSHISPKWKFEDGYLGPSGNFNGGENDGYPFELVWRWADHSMKIRVYRTYTMGNIASDGGSATGYFSGILSVKDVQAEVARLLGNTSSSLCCSPEMTELMQAIERAADFTTTAEPGPNTPCDGISFALQYTTVRQGLMAIGPAPAFENACAP